MKKFLLLSGALMLSVLWFHYSNAAERPEVVGEYTLPRLSLTVMNNPACTVAALAQAQTNGLKFADLLSIGSGLARWGTNEFVGITDRGPNGVVGERRTFPLPQFCPTILRFRLEGHAIVPEQWIPLTDSHGKCITGLNNLPSEEPLYETGAATTPLPPDQNGVDPEGIRVLPDGNFLLSEEYSPSLLVVSPQGQVLMRYTPVSKPLPAATYPVRAILPDEFTRRRVNHGFENLAVSGDGRLAYAILQGPMGNEKDKRYQASRVVRVLKLDISDPLAARVAGEYLMLLSPAGDYPGKQKPEKLKLNDAEWVAPDKLLMIERGKKTAKLRLVDFAGATDVLHHPDVAGLKFEAVTTDLAALGVQPATARTVLVTRDIGLPVEKYEGLTLVQPDEIALANDNDFGLGDNETGEPSRLWLVRLPTGWLH